MKNFIKNLILDEFGISDETLCSGARGRVAVIRRYICYFLKTYTDLDSSSIALMAGYQSKKANTTGTGIWRACQVVQDNLTFNRSFIDKKFFKVEAIIKQKITTPAADPSKDIKEIKGLVSDSRNTKVKIKDEILKICEKYEL